jgi:hypothetical protein
VVVEEGAPGVGIFRDVMVDADGVECRFEAADGSLNCAVLGRNWYRARPWLWRVRIGV